jgi:hypothetical protein
VEIETVEKLLRLQIFSGSVTLILNFPLWSSISSIGQADTRKEAPMTANATPVQTVSSLFVFYDDKAVTPRLPSFAAIPEVPSKVQRPETSKWKNETVLRCIDKYQVWC